MPKVLALLLTVCKWPTAVVAAFLTPTAAREVWNLLREAWSQGVWRSPFGLGFGLAAVGCVLLQRSRFVSFWSTMEHEMTHAVFAWLTLVPVHELRTTDGSRSAHDDRSLGHVHLGGSNWLITISPYFFPTAAVAILAATWLLAAQPSGLARGLLGVATAYSLCSTWRETHRHQTDLHECGFIFAWLLLPGANLCCYGCLLAYEVGGIGRMADFLGAVGAVRSWF